MLKIIFTIDMAISIGSPAPHFTLKYKTASGLQEVSLSDHLGKDVVVLLFFPLAFTGVCTEEMCSVHADLSAYQDLKAKVYAISVDSPFAQEAWAQKNHIGFPVLSDFNREAIRAYDVFCEDLIGLKGVAKRSAFVIDLKGKVAYSWSSDDPKQLPPFEALKKVLAAL